MFHGQGVGIDDNKDDILRYFQEVDRSLSDVLEEPEIPLVLAGVSYLLPIFREVTRYRWIMGEAVTGNPDDLRPEELHKKALAIVRPELERKQREAEARYRELAGKGFTAAGIQAVVPAAAYGRVQTLFVTLGEKRPGMFDRHTSEVILTNGGSLPGGAEDLLDLAVVETIRSGGNVYAIKKGGMPEETQAAVAAILRY